MGLILSHLILVYWTSFVQPKLVLHSKSQPTNTDWTKNLKISFSFHFGFNIIASSGKISLQENWYNLRLQVQPIFFCYLDENQTSVGGYQTFKHILGNENKIVINKIVTSSLGPFFLKGWGDKISCLDVFLYIWLLL